MAQKDPQSPVLTHTQFQAALTINIADIEAGYGDRVPLFMALNLLLAAPGRIRSLWSRIAESPETVLLVTGKPPNSQGPNPSPQAVNGPNTR